MKKYLLLFLFNFIATYMFFIFIFGDGGILDNINQMHTYYEVRYEEAHKELELEKMKAHLSYLQDVDTIDASLLVERGKRLDGMVVLKIPQEIENEEIIKQKQENFLYIMDKKKQTVLMLIGVIALILLGNVFLIKELLSRK